MLLSCQDIVQKWAEVRRQVPLRDDTLQAEMVRQQNNERLRRQFAQKANLVGQWIERHLDAIASVGVHKGSLEDHLGRLHAVDKEVTGFMSNIDELERYNEEVQGSMIFENRHTPYTMEVRRARRDDRRMSDRCRTSHSRCTDRRMSD